jgi:hypothetical protein
MMSDPDRNARTSRLLLIAGAAVAVIAIVSWVAFDSGGKKGGGASPTTTCQVPSGATAGTEPLPALVGTLTAPLGAASTTWTKSSGADTVYSYCYDSVDGEQVDQAITLLIGSGYTQASGADATAQSNFTKVAAKPYGVSLNVSGSLDLTQIDQSAQGGLSIVWTDAAPSTG